MSGPVLGDACRLIVSEGAGTAPTAVDGLTITSWRIVREVVDVSTASDGGWSTLLPEAGSRYIEVEAKGLHFGTLAERQIRHAAVSGQRLSCELKLSEELDVRGDFVVVRLTYLVAVDDEATFETFLRSAGTISVA